VNPPAEKIREAEARQAEIAEARERQRKQAAGRVTRTKICANISRAEEADGLPEKGADGIGLFRSELLFLNGAKAPTEEEQFEAYRHAAEAMEGRETVIRTMDIGSDKHAVWLEMPKEINPALGLRGLRVSLEHRELFRTQLRALLRAAVYGNIRIMIPMIASEWELDEVLREMQTAALELEQRREQYRIPEIGVMIETPAAVMIAPALAEKARFFSIGTNDLTQYTLAVDREARGMDRYCDPMHEAVIRMIAMATEAAHAKHIPVAVCGELAGAPRGTERLIRLGVDELSVSPAKLAQVRERAAEIEDSMAREIRKERDEGIRSPAEGELIPMAEIPDPVFSGGVMGKCVGVIPANGKIYAPVSGTVATVAATRHAVSLRGNGEEILIHAGLDTVRLNGEGFSVYVSEGENVKQGQLIMEMDPELIRARGFNPMIIVVRISS
jgi:glucose-specific phosphotransferase system IIA component